MSTASEGALPERSPGVRATDADRQRTIAHLRTAAGEGAIDLDELEQRIAAAWHARTVTDLDDVTHDLPVPPVPPVPPAPQRGRSLALQDDGFRGHLTVYSLVIGMLVVLWLLGGAGHPWPIYPAMGWGIGLGAHHQAAVAGQRRRLAKAASQGLTLEQLEAKEDEERRRRRRTRRDQLQRTLQQHHRDRVELLRGVTGTAPGARDAAASDDSLQRTRFVVAMFVDVVGSTTLNEALGDELWAAVRRSFRTVVGDAVTGNGGWEVSTSGDGVLARFEQPQAAADAAVQILRRLEQRRGDAGFAVSVRAGIHSGDAVEDGDDIIGNVVNLACRVSEAADRDQVLVTEHVADHLDGRHTTRGTGLHTLKGITRPRHLLSLDWR
ncbi:MAG TPA: DUF1707 domain-containing protein [Acidimicrobiales bacterium]|nr:DUF1707 domain-containing protein [Acidimicrobiales bacterium]